MTASLPGRALESVTLTPSKKHTLIAALGYGVALLVCFFDTFWSMVSIWVRSETYTHAFLVPVIVGWMIWGRRHHLMLHLRGPDYMALFPLLLTGLAWLLGSLVDVLVVQQFALVAMLIAGVWLILGRAAAQIAYPLAYLLFMVPVGEGLVPVMMEFTATFTVAMVELSGIPVYREGLFFILPTGAWSVVEACSGIRYLMASVALGALYAYISYRSVWYRTVFIAVSVVVPIIANGLRAYIIVMLGHWSDMTIATGVDHLIYGWVFFGLVMFLLFFIGGYWQEAPESLEESEQTLAAPVADAGRGSRLAALVGLMAALMWPALLWALEAPVREGAFPRHTELPQSLGHWQRAFASEGFVWQARKGGASSTLAARYHQASRGGEDESHPVRPVQLTLHPFYAQSQGAELVAGEDLFVPDADTWRVLARQGQDHLQSVLQVAVREVWLQDLAGQQLLVWQWYRVGDQYAGNGYLAKLLEAREKLSLGRRDAARIFVATQVASRAEVDLARARLQVFVEAALPDMEGFLDQAAGVSQ